MDRVKWGLWCLALCLVAACGGRAATPPATQAAATAATATVTDTATVAPPVAPAAVATATDAPARAAAPGELYVDVRAPRGAVSPLASGVTWGPLWTVRLEVMPLAQALKPGIISFPGGEYGDTNDLQPLQIDRFIELCRAVGAEPLIHVRLPNSTPEQAVALLDYANKQKGYNVKYWAIGNEPNLYPGRYPDVPWDADYFATEWRRFADALKRADPAIKLVGPEITQFVGTEDLTRSDNQQAADWMRAFLAMNGDLVDYVSLHRYPFPEDMLRPADTKPEQLFANAPEWDTIIPALRALMVETTGRELPIAVTEVNSHFTRAFGRPASPDSLPNAIWWGDVFMRLLRQHVDLVAFWSLVTADSQGGWGLLSQYEARPTYYTFMFYQQLGHDLVAADVGADGVQALAARRDDGALTLMVSNLNTTPQTLTLQVDGAEPSGGEVWRLDAEHLGTQVAGESAAGGSQITLPPESLTLYVMK